MEQKGYEEKVSPFAGGGRGRPAWPRSVAALAAHTDTPAGKDYYAKLGVSTFINAAGTKTVLTAACMPPSVQAAMAQVAKHRVHLRDLQEKAGAYVANRTNNCRCRASAHKST